MNVSVFTSASVSAINSRHKGSGGKGGGNDPLGYIAAILVVLLYAGIAYVCVYG